MNHFNRRHFLGGASALAVTQALPAYAFGKRAMPAATSASVQALLAEIAEELLVDYPEGASLLGIDKGARAALKSKLTDHSPDGVRRQREHAAARLQRLKAIDGKNLDAATRIDLDVVRTAHEIALDGYRFPYGDVALLNNFISYRNTPYVVAHNNGAFVDIPDFLDSRHAIGNAADAGAYLARLEAYARALDGETARLAHDSALGVVMPDFLLDKALRQMKAARSASVGEWGLVTSIARRTTNMAGDYARQAEAIITADIIPALDRQIAELERHRARATSDAGVWKLPDGEAFYAWALRAATTTKLSPEEIHAVGLEQVRSLQSEMDALLRALGLSQGSVSDRILALGKRPEYAFPDNDEGRAQILAYATKLVEEMRAQMPRVFSQPAPGNVVVKRVPVEIENGTPNAYAGAGTIDGSVPGQYYINLRNTANWPRFALPTLSYHEAIPGHIWSGEYSQRLPLVRSLLDFSAWGEGWGLYAEQLGDELGVYANDPAGRLGYLQSMAFRACRLAVDTGLHAKRWTREQAIQWFVEATGRTVDSATSEIDRYCVWPGQACAYKIGHNEINRLRKKAQAALGARFDLRQFNDAVISTNMVPLAVLERVVDAYIAAERG